MRLEIDYNQIREIDSTLNSLIKTQNIMKDGAICIDRYSCANLRVMWILKQNINYGYCNYSDQLKRNLDKVPSSPTWRRLAHASHGLLSGITDYENVKKHGYGECIDSLFSTAIVNVNKELGGPQSSDQSVHHGYEKYREIVSKQIHALAPDLVIVCMAGSNESMKPIVESIYKVYTGEPNFIIRGHSEPRSSDVAWSKSGDRTLLWAYHPSYTHITDSDYFTGLMNAYRVSGTLGISE